LITYVKCNTGKETLAFLKLRWTENHYKQRKLAICCMSFRNLKKQAGWRIWDVVLQDVWTDLTNLLCWKWCSHLGCLCSHMHAPAVSLWWFHTSEWQLELG